MPVFSLPRFAAALLAAAAMQSAFAQYVWLDENGVRQYSDRPPPASVPEKRILKQPGSPGRPLSEAAEAPAAAPADAAAQPTLADRDADFKKRRKEQVEKERKTAEETRAAEEKKRSCDRAREYLKALDSGERITRTGATGEREFLSDEQRAREVREARDYVDRCR
ncbi:DUF4124 domain-containing protein [Oxalobacteraceae bacterium OM1]|nr:DUF4124 domain-containing protein [Oxalobacteraceae bacterium OM1]